MSYGTVCCVEADPLGYLYRLSSFSSGFPYGTTTTSTTTTTSSGWRRLIDGEIDDESSRVESSSTVFVPYIIRAVIVRNRGSL
mmetsp:Transcript_23038/g.50273  ORF Transcript_23038/g.50273 Transcript_23038/m.50273 type:complete len:83 (+) Transcript_23038:622-870(+)